MSLPDQLLLLQWRLEMSEIGAREETDEAGTICSLGEVVSTLRAGERALRELLSPLEPTRFAAEYWERRPFHSPGTEARAAGFRFGVDEFWSAAEEAGTKLKATGAAGGVGISVERAKALFSAGQTVVIDDVDTQFPPARALCVLAKAGLGHVGTTTVNCYLSPEGGGYGLHFDQHSVLLLQLSGAKIWHYGEEPAIESPDAHWADVADAAYDRPSWARDLEPPREADLRTCELRPGGVLYLPSGTWHRGRARGHSLAFTLTFGPASFGGMLQSLFTRRLRDETRFRQFIPLGATPEARREFLSSRLRGAKELMDSVTVDDLLDACNERVHSFVLPSLPRPRTMELRPHDRLSPPEWFGTTVAFTGETLRFFFLNKKVTVPISARPFVDRLLRQTTTFVAEQACGWGAGDEPLPWDEVRPVLQMFVARGLLSRAPASAGGRG